jgi:hypothetical protein
MTIEAFAEAAVPDEPDAPDVPLDEVITPSLNPLDAAADLSWLADAYVRITSGKLYMIKVKTSGDESDDVIVPFIPNPEQLDFMSRLWTRNCILKSRQKGFTTLIAIIWLDHALFNAAQYCGMIAQNKEAAENIFSDKIILAYNNLPETLKAAFPLRRCSKSEVEFAHNGSKMRVATSVRSGTLDRLHVSEFGKISARDPAKAKEIITGSFPAVPTNGIIVVESTAEGREGEFYKMVVKALAQRDAIEAAKRTYGKSDSRAKMSRKQFRIMFYPWWGSADNSLPEDDAASVVVSAVDEEYFVALEGEVTASGRPLKLTRGQKAWWCAERDNLGGDENMWQENPGTPAEAFKVSVKGVYYAQQLTAARKHGRIGFYPHVPGTPVNTFWDIGSSDGTGIWLHQLIGAENRFIGYIEAWEEPYSYFVTKLQATGYLWGVHNLPHDADAKRQQGQRVVSPKEELEESKIGGQWQCVPRVDDLQNGIQLVRKAFSSCTFDEAGCKEGIEHLWNYRKKWNKQAAAWSDTPDKAGGHSEAADALRQFAQAGGAGTGSSGGPTAESLAKWKNRKRGVRS